MKEQIHTIPVNDAFLSGDECPFCYLERMVEQRSIRYFLGPGASYMEPDVRAVTDREGFCRQHYKKLFDFGNALGNALMMQTYYAGLLEELEQQAKAFELPAKRRLFGGNKKQPEDSELLQWARRKQDSCCICNRIDVNMRRYYSTFFALIKDAEFRSRVEQSKGFCMDHFAKLLECAKQELPNTQRQWFYETAICLMRENLRRVKEDIDWFCGMFDYRQVGADWKNSRDAVPRGMQKLKGGHPADKPFQTEF